MMVSGATIVLIVYFIQGTLGHAVPQSPVLRIAGGDTVDIEDVPYMASVHVGIYYCGGSIISQWFVLTAAHCAVKEQNTIDDDYVRVGSSNLNKGGRKYTIAKYIPHEEYSASSLNRLNYDLGLLKLSWSLTFGPTVAKIELAISNPKIYPGIKALVSGWGQTEPAVETQTLHAASVTIAPLSKCLNYYKREKLTYKNICGYDFGVGVCSGDSGSPLVVGGQQVGVASAANNKKCGYAPGIYVNVTAHSGWINYHLNMDIV